MPHIKCDEFTKDTDVLVEFTVFDERVDPAVEVVDGITQLDLTFYDDTDTELVGPTWPIDMLPYDGTRNKYIGIVPKSAVVTINERVRLEVVMAHPTVGDTTFHLRSIPVVENVPE